MSCFVFKGGGGGEDGVSSPCPETKATLEISDTEAASLYITCQLVHSCAMTDKSLPPSSLSPDMIRDISS